MGGDSRRGGRRGALTREDSDLWQYVTRDVRPVRAKPRVPDVQAGEDGPPPAARAFGKGSARTVGIDGRAPELKPARPPPPRPEPSAPPSRPRPAEPAPQPVVLERRKARRIARGHHEIEARLDLHGQTQDEAHAALTAFIRRCHAAGLRTVLVITGKGGPAPERDAHAAPVHHPARPRGVLKRNVPRWLAGPELRPYVISFSSAHVRHGGDGALYVMLRRPG